MRRGRRSSRLDTARLALAGAAIAVGFAAQLAGAGAGWSWPAFALAIGLAGVAPARKAWLSLKRRSLDINVLMVVAVAGALAHRGVGRGRPPSSCLFAVVAVARSADAWSGPAQAIRALMDAGARRGAGAERSPRARSSRLTASQSDR